MAWFKLPFQGSPVERRLARARRHIAVEFFNDALLELDGVDGDQAGALRAQATAGMIRLNLQEWRARTAAGERQDARDALDRARRYGATDNDIEEFRKASAWETAPPTSTPRSRPRP